MQILFAVSLSPHYKKENKKVSLLDLFVRWELEGRRNTLGLMGGFLASVSVPGYKALVELLHFVIILHRNK